MEYKTIQLKEYKDNIGNKGTSLQKSFGIFYSTIHDDGVFLQHIEM